MAYSYEEFIGDGVTQTFTIPFSYVKRSEVNVFVGGTQTTDFEFLTDATINIATAPLNGVVVRISRVSDLQTRAVDFVAGAVLSEEDLDTAVIQVFNAAQEAVDKSNEALFKTPDGKWDAQSRVIKNLAAPTDAGDAVNKGTIDNLYPFVATVAGSIGNVNTVGAAIGNVNTVAGSITNVNTVAGNNTNVSKVAAVDAKVTTVANNDANVTTVANNIASVNTTAASIAGVNTTAGSIGNVNTVATNIANVNAVAGNNTNVTAVATNANNINAAVTNAGNINAVVANATNINTVSANNANVTKVANIDTKVTTVANNDANVTTVAGINSAVSTVAGISGNVTTVANNNSNVTSVANNSANINSAVGNAANINAAVSNSANINAVVANAANINTVAGVNAAVSTVASNIAAVLDAPNQASGAAASAVSAASSAATAAALLDNFDDRYLGAKASDPALDNDGNALIVGALYFNTTDGVMKIYTSSGWIAASSASVATLATFEYVATGGQTVFTGADANGQTLSYTAPAIMVTLNGVRLRPDDDYTATDGVNITLVSAATAGDELVVDAFGNFLVADTYSKAQTDALIGAVDLSSRVAKSGDTMTGELAFAKDAGNHITFQSADQSKFYGRIMVSDNNDAYGSGERLFIGDGNNDVVIGTSNGSGTPANSYISLQHGGSVNIGAGSASKHLSIDSAGRVTMPYQPMACSSWTSFQSVNNIISSNAPYTITNVGNHLNAGIFTCPVYGVYRATLTAMSGNGNNINARLRFNGANYWGSDTFAAFSPTATYSRVVISALVVCSASDTLDFYLDNGSGSIHPGYGQISFELVG